MPTKARLDKVHLAMHLSCPSCASKNVRPSHWFSGDLSRAIILKFPMRCRSCRIRFYEWLPKIVFSRKHRHTKTSN
jgi:hypothetical protein